jgi:hypothetical protein
MAKTPIALASFLPEDQSSISGDSHQHLDLDEEEDEAVEDADHHDETSECDEEEDEGTDNDLNDDDNQEGNTDDDDDAKDHIKSTTSTRHVAESILLPLPSHLGLREHPDQTVAALSEEELIIRQSQASDSLQHLRLSLGMKCAVFRKMVSNAKSQKKKTRAWQAVGLATAAVQQHAQSYCLAQHALTKLNADQSILSKYPPLQKQDLTVSCDIVEENRLGQKSDLLSWVWRFGIGKEQDRDAWMDESE